MKPSRVVRNGRIEAPLQVIDTDGQSHQLPQGVCEIEQLGSQTALRVGAPGHLSEVRIPQLQFESLFAARRVVFLSW